MWVELKLVIYVIIMDVIIKRVQGLIHFQMAYINSFITNDNQLLTIQDIPIVVGSLMKVY